MQKEQIQKIAIVVIMGIAGLYVYSSLLLGPLGEREKRATAAIKKEEPKIKAAKSKILQVTAIAESDVHSVAAGEVRETLKASIPEGASVAWLPQRFSEFFKRQGIERVNSRPTSETKNEIFPEYKSSVWEIAIPRVEFTPLAVAIAGLENENGLLQIDNFQINALPADVQFQGAKLSVTTLVKQ